MYLEVYMDVSLTSNAKEDLMELVIYDAYIHTYICTYINHCPVTPPFSFVP